MQITDIGFCIFTKNMTLICRTCDTINSTRAKDCDSFSNSTRQFGPFFCRIWAVLTVSKSPKIGPYQDGEVDRSIGMEGNVVLALGLELVTTLVVYGSSKTRSFSKCSFIKPSSIWTFSGNSFHCSIFFDRLTFLNSIKLLTSFIIFIYSFPKVTPVFELFL